MACCRTSSKRYAWICLCLFVILPIVSSSTQKLNVSMAEFVEGILTRKGYRSNTRPGIDLGTPTIVTLNIFVNSISAINDFNMEYSMTFYLRQSWRDFRLAYSEINRSVTLNYNDLYKIWVPDLFFRNEKSGMLHDITVPNRLIRLDPDGTLLYSQRVSLRLDCYMQLHKFPLDEQKCRMEIGSYGYTTADLVFRWKDFGALSIKEKLELPEFGITGSKVGDCTRVFSTGAFACVYAEFHFKRKFEFYLLQAYIPSLLVVVLSWVSFWIDIEAVPARTSLGLLTVLTMTTQASAISARLPRVSYIKGIDVWMSACLLFVFGALIEFSAVNVLFRKEKNRLDARDLKRKKAKESRGLVADSDMEEQHDTDNLYAHHGKGEEGGPLPRQRIYRGSQKEVYHNHDQEIDFDEGKQGFLTMYLTKCFGQAMENRAVFIDASCRFVFPGLFTLFSLVYWVLYGLVF